MKLKALALVGLFSSQYNENMNAEHRALAEYLEGIFEQKLDELRVEMREGFKDVNRTIKNQIDFVDRKNEEQDEVAEDHELRIKALEPSIT